VGGNGYAAVFSMATRPQYRRRGVAGGVLAELRAWSREKGHGQMYLQVVRDNVAAIRLYERAGFTFGHRYHYRVLRGRAIPFAEANPT
jgi:ribosomal protein S18 acetylase RimI-like enzyme